MNAERAPGMLLAVLALGSGGWAVWPHVFPAVREVRVERSALPAPEPTQGQAVAAALYPTSPSVTPLISGRVNVNTASREQLEALPRIGPALAERIVQGRPYRSPADLDAVKGIGPKLLETLGPLVSFE